MGGGRVGGDFLELLEKYDQGVGVAKSCRGFDARPEQSGKLASFPGVSACFRTTTPSAKRLSPANWTSRPPRPPLPVGGLSVKARRKNRLLLVMFRENRRLSGLSD